MIVLFVQRPLQDRPHQRDLTETRTPKEQPDKKHDSKGKYRWVPELLSDGYQAGDSCLRHFAALLLAYGCHHPGHTGPEPLLAAVTDKSFDEY